MGISKTASKSSNVGRRVSMGHIKISGQKLFPVSFQFINYDYEYVHTFHCNSFGGFGDKNYQIHPLSLAQIRRCTFKLQLFLFLYNNEFTFIQQQLRDHLK